MFTVEINDTEVLAALDRATSVLTDATAMMNAIGDFLHGQVEDRFQTQAGPDGTAWAPRSAVTLKSYERRKLKFGGILHLSGQLSGNIFHDYDAESVRVGSPEPWAAVQQFGAAQGAFGAFMGKDKLGRDHFHHLPWGNIPARPYLGFSDEDREGIIAIVTETIAAALEG
ncbi:MAG: phage virion morphogenesis protein [Pseudomonadota bacterium]